MAAKPEASVADAVAGVVVQPSQLSNVFGSRRFFFLAAGVVATSAVFYEWYKDTYATPAERLARVRADYVVGMRKLARVRTELLREMAKGLDEPDSTPKRLKRSSLKMLGSNVFNIPTGEEMGVFYTLDWGGSNYRVLRIKLKGRGLEPESSELKTRVSKEFQVTDNAQMLFDWLAEKVKEHMKKHGDYIASKPFPVGFTFSFPMTQPELHEGILINWTKGYDIPGVVGKDVTKLMHAAFDRFKVPLEIKAVVNDTVGTLLACAYDHNHCKIGVILGTGTNAAYVEPRNGEIINTEWGALDKGLPRTPIDYIMDAYTQNTGEQLVEKMMSGFYLGELVRLLAIEVFRSAVTKRLPSDSRLRIEWGFDSELVSDILRFGAEYATVAEYLRKECKWAACSSEDARVFQEICQLIVDRSADLTAAMLSAVMEKAGLFVTRHAADGQPFELDRYEVNAEFCDGRSDDDSWLTVGFDGSVFKYVPRYQKRMKDTLCRILGDEIGNRIGLVHAEDGSGKGAALAVASQFHAMAATAKRLRAPSRTQSESALY